MNVNYLIFEIHLAHQPGIRVFLTTNWVVRFQVLTAASMMFRIVFWDVLPCKMIDNLFTWQYIPEDNSEQHIELLTSMSLKVTWTFLTIKLWFSFSVVHFSGSTRSFELGDCYSILCIFYVLKRVLFSDFFLSLYHVGDISFLYTFFVFYLSDNTKCDRLVDG
jgi:hypothetical protein